MSLLGKWFGFGRDEIYDEALRAFDRASYEEAAEAFQECLELAKDSSTTRLAKFYLAESHAQLARGYLKAESYEAAVASFGQAIGLYPNYPDLHLGLCKAHRALGDTEKQNEELAEALRLNPFYSEAVLFDGIVLIENGEIEKGLERVREAVALDVNLDGERYAFALKCLEEGDVARANANFAALASASSNDANLHGQVAESFIRQRLFEEAASELETALRLAPGYADLRCRYGQVLLELDRVEEAAEQLRQAVSINPNYAEAHAQLGIALKRLRREREARAEFKRVLELNPDHSIAQMELGRVL